MTRGGRLLLLAAGSAGLAAAMAVAFAGVPSFGGPISGYARLLNHLAPLQRRVTDVVSAVSFDYRGIDTLFEEFILFSAVAGISVVLRPLADEIRGVAEDQAPGRRIPPPSPAVGLLGVILSPLLVVVAVETVTHGQLSPGGGFQGGVVMASALFVVFLATDYATAERYQPKALLDAAEGAGAGGYVAIGVIGLLAGAAYLANVVSLGKSGSIISGGTIPLLNAVVGVEVAGGFALLAAQFLDQTSVIRPQPGQPEATGRESAR
jgi:multicomponent Na+:H+ antiporter subunit B